MVGRVWGNKGAFFWVHAVIKNWIVGRVWGNKGACFWVQLLKTGWWKSLGEQGCLFLSTVIKNWMAGRVWVPISQTSTGYCYCGLFLQPALLFTIEGGKHTWWCNSIDHIWRNQVPYFVITFNKCCFSHIAASITHIRVFIISLYKEWPMHFLLYHILSWLLHSWAANQSVT